MSRKFAWPADWPFAKKDYPLIVFEATKVKAFYDRFMAEDPEVLEDWFLGESAFHVNLFSQPERQFFCKFAATNERVHDLPMVLGSLTEYSEADAKFLNIFLYFIRFYRPYLEDDAVKRRQYLRVYRACLVHTQRISRIFPNYKMYQIKGLVSDAVRMFLIDDGFKDEEIGEDIFEGLSVTDEI